MGLRPKKVIFIIYNLAGGGAERALVNLLENLDRKRMEPICIFHDSNHQYILPKDIRTLVLEPGGAEQRIAQIKKIIERENPDVVFSFLSGVNIEVIMASRSFSRSRKIIVSERTTPTIFLSENKYRNKRALIKKLYPKVDKIIAVSGGVKNDLVKNFNIFEEKIKIIYNGVDIDKIKNLAKEEITEQSWFKEKKPIIINVASLRVLKGQEYLLKAFKIVRKKTDCRLVILGSGETEIELKKLSKELAIQNDVVFLGFQANPFKFMAKSSLFVLCSICEGFPNVILEAMACGVPVISTDCPCGPNEIIKHRENGILVPVKDETSLAKAIINLLVNKELAKRLSHKAREDIKRFSIDRMVGEYTKVLLG